MTTSSFVTPADLAESEARIRACAIEGHVWSPWSDEERGGGELRHCHRCSAVQFFSPRRLEAPSD